LVADVAELARASPSGRDAGHFGTAKYWSEVLEAITASL
jgi:hypothetical protein